MERHRVPIGKQKSRIDHEILVEMKRKVELPIIGQIIQAIRQAPTKTQVRKVVAKGYPEGIAPPKEYQRQLQRARQLRLAELNETINHLVEYQEDDWRNSGPTPMSDLGTGTVGNDI